MGPLHGELSAGCSASSVYQLIIRDFRGCNREFYVDRMANNLTDDGNDRDEKNKITIKFT